MNTAETIDPIAGTVEELTATAALLREARDRATGWLLNTVQPDGEPADAEIGNGWSRIPWALALVGETATASAVMDWIARHRINDDGTLVGGESYGRQAFAPYALGHVAMGAILLERHDVYGRILHGARSLQDPVNGGLHSGGALGDACDILSTSQLGLAAVFAGDTVLADGVRTFLQKCWDAQPDLPNRLFAAMRGDTLLTDPPQGYSGSLIVDFEQPRGSYFYPGIAAAFLSSYGARYSDPSAISLAHKYLDINIQGTTAQFEDPESVQICKFGWGLALTQIADSTTDYSHQVLRMSKWFIEHQNDDGSWAPSTFVSAEPTRIQKMTKTAEHAMEVSSLLAALGTLQARKATSSHASN